MIRQQNDKFNNAKKVVVWGLGHYGKKILSSLVFKYNKQVVAFVDSNKKLWNSYYCGIPVVAPESINELDYELVLITVNHPRSIVEIKDKLNEMGVPEEKMHETISDHNHLDLFFDQRFYWIRDFAEWIKTQKIEGNVAECGVFRGESAKFINYFFPDKKLYLFDTFEGFAKEDLKAERELKSEKFNQSVFNNTPIFDETSISYVMKKMCYPENIIIKKGYFPDSAEGIEDRFCFVNLDMDLYVPMLNGLHFFWDRLEEGGAILLHDYFCPELPGVKAAVEQFEKDRSLNVIKAPIGDNCSIVLFKGKQI